MNNDKPITYPHDEQGWCGTANAHRGSYNGKTDFASSVCQCSPKRQGYKPPTPQSSADLGSEDVCMCGNYEKDHTGYEGHTFTSMGTHDSGYKVTVREALLSAKNFIQNGVELGFIRMPDADTPDQAHNTLPKINEALDILDQQAAPETTHLFNGKVYSRRLLEAENTKMRDEITALRERVEGMRKELTLKSSHNDVLKITAHNAACDQFLRILDEVIGRE